MRAALLGLLMLLLVGPVHAQELAVGIYRVTPSVSPTPAKVGTAHLSMRVTKPTYVADRLASLPATGLACSVTAGMPEMPGMAPTRAVLKEGDGGVYEGEVALTMPGAWRLQVELDGPQGKATFSVPLTVEGGGGGVVAASPDGAAPSPSGAPDTLPSPRAPASPSASGPASPSPRDATSPAAGAAAPTVPGGPAIRVRPRGALAVGDRVLLIEVKPAMPDVEVIAGFTMPGMPMVLPPRSAQRVGDGTYGLAVRFPMAGVYALTVDVRRANARLQRQTFQLEVAGPSGAWTRRLPLLLMAAVFVLVGCVGGLALIRDRLSLRTLVGCLLCVGLPLLAGVLLARPADDAMGMPMDMAAPDMGMSFPDLASPVPAVLQAVAPRPFVRTVAAGGVLAAEGEAVVPVGRAGALAAWKVSVGDRVAAGQSLAVVGNVEVRAPRAGIVTARLAEVGQPLRPDAPLLRLAALGLLRFEGRVPSADAAQLFPGAETYVTTLDNLRYDVRVGDVSSLIDPATQTVRVTGGVPDPENRLRIGQQVGLRFVTARREGALIIPAEAVFEAGGRPAVWKVDDVAGQLVVRRQIIRIAWRSEPDVEVADGLVAGDRVVVSRIDPLEEGRVVTPAAFGAGAYRDLPLPVGPGPGAP